MKCVSLWPLATLVQCLLLGWRPVQATASVNVSLHDLVTTAMIDAEIRATQEHVELLKSKALLLQRMLDVEQDLVTRLEAQALANTTNTNRRTPYRSPRLHERFGDWFEPQTPWFSMESSVDASVDMTGTTSSVHAELITFRPSGSVGGKKNNLATRQDPDDPTRATLQFVMALNKQNGALDLYHPITKALVWQQRLEIPAPIARVHFHSDRGAHLIVLTANGDMLLYAVRIFHGRRLVAGDYRRFSGLERSWCKYQVQLPPENRISYSASPAWNNQFDPKLTGASTARTLSPAGLHTHLEVELAFVTRPPSLPSVATTVVSYQAFYIVTGDSNGELSFFHGQNGSLIDTLPTRLGPIKHLELVSSGVVAFTVANRIHFVDTYDRRLLDLTCEGSRHNITSLNRDLWRHSALYVGTSDGTGLAFRINRFGLIKRNNGIVSMGADAERLIDSEQDTATCSLTAILRPRVSAFNGILHAPVQRPAIVTALPGYVLLASGDGHLVLYEASSSNIGAPEYITEKPISSVHSSPSSRVVAIDSVSDLHLGGTAVAVSVWEPAHSRIRMELLASRVPPQSSSIELGWIRAPMMLLCAVGVMFWQQNKARRPASSSSLSSLGLDLPGLRNHRKGHSGGSDWSRSANHRMRGGF